MGETVPHIDIKNPNKLWTPPLRPFFGCSMEQLRALMESDNIEEDMAARDEWLQRYGYFFPRYAKDKSLEK